MISGRTPLNKPNNISKGVKNFIWKILIIKLPQGITIGIENIEKELVKN
jgi:hypothetical protein